MLVARLPDRPTDRQTDGPVMYYYYYHVQGQENIFPDLEYSSFQYERTCSDKKKRNSLASAVLVQRSACRSKQQLLLQQQQQQQQHQQQ